MSSAADLEGSSYVELHAHSCYSFLDGTSFPEELIAQAVGLGLPALALTDHDNLHGAWEFAQTANESGLQPITGAEVTLDNETHLTLLVENPEGYRNLCRLITRAHHATGDERVARLPRDALAEYAEGLILLTGCRQSELCVLIDANRPAEARACLRRYQEWFGADNVYVELQRNLVRGDTRRLARLAQLAAEADAPIVATGNVHYHVPERAALQDVLVAIRHRLTLEGSSRERRPNGEWFLPSAELMQRRFRHYPEAIANTQRIAARCAGFNLVHDFTYRFPDYTNPTGEPTGAQLVRITRQRLEERYGDDTRARARLEEELALIERHGLSGFFLIYADIMQLAADVADEVRGPSPVRRRSNLPPGRGRGSSVSSIVCYLLGMSHVDPLGHDLFLGRFLHDDLSEAPDIDLDFPRDIRARLIERLYEVYPGRVGLVCAFPTYRLRGAIRDVGMALGLPAPLLDRLAKLSGHDSADAIDTHLAGIPGLPYPGSPLWQHFGEICRQIGRLPRHISQHSGGMVVSSQPLNEIVPMQPAAMEGRTLIQWDKDTISDARMIKIDLLGLGMLSAVEESLELIGEQGMTPPDLSEIRFDDPNIYQMIQRGETIGTFQIESRAQIQTILKTQPENLADLVVQVSIVRPGPIVGGATKPWIRAREQFRAVGYADITYDHPSLAPVLEETYGVILYQEQIIEVAMKLSNFTSGQADRLRRAMSRKRSEAAMQAIWEDFRAGALANGVDEATIVLVFDKIRGFARYGFPKAHAVSFAVLAYQTAYLRYYFPAELFAALLNQYPMGFYPPHVLVNDAKRQGIRILPLDLNASRARCSVQQRTIRIGLGYVLGISDDESKRIELDREAHGPFRSLADTIRRVPLRREIVERLILVGGFDWTGLRRRELLWQLGLLWMQTPADRPPSVASQQLTLGLPTEQDMVTLTPLSAWERMQADYRILGLSPHWHPLLLLRARLPARVRPAATVGDTPHGSNITVGGLVVCRQKPSTAKGVLFLLLEDETGLVNVVVHPRLAESQRQLIRRTPLLAVVGRFERQGDAVNIVAQQILPLQTLVEETQADAQPMNQRAIVERLLATSHNFR